MKKREEKKNKKKKKGRRRRRRRKLPISHERITKIINFIINAKAKRDKSFEDDRIEKVRNIEEKN